MGKGDAEMTEVVAKTELKEMETGDRGDGEVCVIIGGYVVEIISDILVLEISDIVAGF